MAKSIERRFSIIAVSFARSAPPSSAVVIIGATSATGTSKIDARMIRIPCTVPPRVRTMIPMMMAAIATGQTRIHDPQPTIGINETTKVMPSSNQLTSENVFVLRGAAWTIGTFGLTAAAAGVG